MIAGKGALFMRCSRNEKPFMQSMPESMITTSGPNLRILFAAIFSSAAVPTTIISLQFSRDLLKNPRITAESSMMRTLIFSICNKLFHFTGKHVNRLALGNGVKLFPP